MDLLVIHLRSNQLKFLFVAAKPQEKTIYYTIAMVEGCLVTSYPCTAA